MKLWQKLSAICVAVLLLTVGACSALLLLNSREKMISVTIDSGVKELEILSESLAEMVAYHGKADLSPVVRRSLIKYCFTKYAGGSAALFSDDGTLFSSISFDPRDFLPNPGQGGSDHYLGTVDGHSILVASRSVDLLSQKYSIYIVRDITQLYQSISQMIRQFAAISAAMILIGTALIVLLVRLATKPLKSLGRSARRIAEGQYSERVNVATADEVGELAHGFNAMAAAVQSHFVEQQEAMDRQQLFIGGLTHEFKTPLTSIIGHTETLLYTRMPEDVVLSSLNHIHEQSRWLERLTQKLLRLISLQEDIERREESVADLLAAVEESVAETLQKRSVGLAVSCDAGRLAMDFDLMRSLLVNLVDNAAKASAAGQCVELRACGHAIEVEDHGIGMPAEEMSRILEPFYMVDKSRSRKLGGSGLGLALAKRIADAHGARLEIASELGRGTRVTVAFPDNKMFTVS